MSKASVRAHFAKHRPHRRTAERTLRRRHALSPVAAAVLAVASGWALPQAQAQSDPKSAWFAVNGAVQNQVQGQAGPMPGANNGLLNSAARQHAESRQQLARSVENLGRTASAIAAQQAAQQAAREAAKAAGVPDGHVQGGLWDRDASGNLHVWTGADRPVQSTADGKTTVAITQTESRAVLNWETFNVGRNTVVAFEQKPTDAVLNRVVGAGVAPSQIQGAIKGAGTVMVVNQNGVVFSGSSQVNVRNLVTAATEVDVDHFRNNGLYDKDSSRLFKNAAGKVLVEQGAQITTHTPPTGSTQDGGYVLLLGAEVHNAGHITTPKGQTVLAAGDNFYIRKGVGTDGNANSTTAGNEVSTSRIADSTAGKVTNTGLIAAATGDITLTGREVTQAGVAVASTSQAKRGTIHLSTRASDTEGAVTLGKDSTTAILLEGTDTTALDNQRDAALKNLDGTTPTNNAAGVYDNLSTVTDRRDLSRVEIVSGNTVEFQGDSTTLATGGEIVVSAKHRTLVDEAARLDVSGAMGVKVAMEANNLSINIQGNEQRDAPVNRDSKTLNNLDIWLDRRRLIHVPAGTNGYEGDRWYTEGGLLEVSGWLATSGHSVGEWMAQGGTITVTGNDLVTRAGSQINLSGGTLDVQSGYMRQSWLRGADGRLYAVDEAAGDLLYEGLYTGYEQNSERWGQTRAFYNPILAPTRRYEEGYTVGRDAGKLVVATSNAILEGDIVSDVYQGAHQNQAAQAGLEGYYQSQLAVARRGQLIVGQYIPVFDADQGLLRFALTPLVKGVVLADVEERIAGGLQLNDAVAGGRQGRLVLDAGMLNGAELGAIRIAAQERIGVEGALTVAPGGEIALHAPVVEVAADLTAHGGAIRLGNVLLRPYVTVDSSGNETRKVYGVEDVVLAAPAGVAAAVRVDDGVALDASGLWRNLALAQPETAGLPFLDGGGVTLRSTGSVMLGVNSLIDVSSGAVMLMDGSWQGGRGGSVTLAANANHAQSAGELLLGGDLRAYGAKGGGSLSLQAGRVLIDYNADSAAPGTLLLRGNFFDKGFSSYQLTGNTGLEVAEGTRVDVSMPVYRQSETISASGAPESGALALWTPPLYLENALKGVLTQRQGASLSLQTGNGQSQVADMADTALLIGKGAVINVDPGQSISLQGIGQISVDGALNAWGGRIDIRQGKVSGAVGVLDPIYTNADGSSIWIGQNAILDVAARAVTAVDAQGRRYGQVRDGGSIVIGGEIDHVGNNVSLAMPFVVVREGALLDASGSSAVLDIAGQGTTMVTSNGGSIALASASGLYLDGAMRALAGGVGAAGGSLEVAMGMRVYGPQAPDRLRQVHELVVGQEIGGSELAAGIEAGQAAQSLRYGRARVGVDQVEAGGFHTLSLYSGGMIAFDGDVNLAMGRSLNLYAGSLGLTEAAAADTQVRLSAPYVRLAGATLASMPDNATGFGLTGMHYGAPAPSLSQQPGAGVFTLEAGSLLEIEGKAGLGSGGSLTLTRSHGSEQVDRRAFDGMHLLSQGDIRFGSGSLYVPGDLTLAAAQIYPGTGATAAVHAGWQGANSGYAADRSLVIARTTDTAPALPYSVFGRLTLGASSIEQGGVLHAPLGALSFGLDNAKQRVQSIRLLPGSQTSVSAQGLMMPYGGTVDGVSWEYNGETLALLSAGGTAATNLRVGVTTASASLDVQQGAVLDLSGGGELLGAAFVSGRGGSTDARFTPLMQYGSGGFVLPTLSTNQIYALVPGVQSGYAPSAQASGARDPARGQQVTIGAGVPGLPAGTYTLLPSVYALLPGAFRVEVNGLAGTGGATAATAMRNGSWSVSGVMSVAGTGIRDSLSSQLIVTPADVLRTYSQFNETSYADFVRADAVRQGVPRGMLEVDAKTWSVVLTPHTDGEVGFRFDGSVDFRPQEGGYGGTFALMADSTAGRIEVLADGAPATAAYASVYASDLNAVGAARLSIGALPYISYGQGGNFVELGTSNRIANAVVVRSGATLAAPEVLLVAAGTPSRVGGIEVEQGATISTLGQGVPAYSSDDGYVYRPGAKSVLAVSNGRLQMLASAVQGDDRPGPIRLGTCSGGDCAGTTRLYSEGSIVFATDNEFQLDDAVLYGTRHLALAVSGINVGSVEALAAAAGRGSLASGLTLNQQVLERLLHGDTSTGAPALQTLELTAAESMNFYESVTLSTLDDQGVSLLDNLMLTTPGLYGYGTTSDLALIRTRNLIWNGTVGAPGAVIADGAGTGSGKLSIEAQNIVFGFGGYAQPDAIQSYDRLALGFANVSLQAREQISANHRGSLAVYQQQGAYVTGEGFQYSGGNLDIVTPLFTGSAGSINHIRAGGDIKVGAIADAEAAQVGGESLGAELSISGRTLHLYSSVVLPSGKLRLSAEEGLLLAEGADIDLSGRTISLNDVDQYGWGGDLILESRNGDILQAAGSRIDLSARHNKAGSLTATALDVATGTVQLLGSIIGSASGYYDAGGTAVPYKAGSIEVRAQRLGSDSLSNDFAALNARLNAGGMFAARSFQLKQGDLTLGNAGDGSALLKAGEINLSVDGGRLVVNGTVDASGERVGSIRLAGRQGLALGSGAVLDAHGSILRVDSYGQIIDAPNRAIVELNSGDGRLILADGARIDLRHGTSSAANDGKARGTLELNAPRLGSQGSVQDADAATYGDVAIEASGNLEIQGARSIALNAVQRYDDSDPDAQLHDGGDAASGRPYRVIDQAYLDAKHLQSQAFINAALANGALLHDKLAGLTGSAYDNAFHLRPGVEISSVGDLAVQGDLDLSGFRYASLNPNTPLTGLYGSGEVGSLVMRASGNLDIYGSINDGFAPPPETPDDDGWVLVPGIQPYDGELIVPRAGIVLADGTTFAGGTTLNYDLPIKALTLPAGTRVPVQVTLTGTLVIPAGTVLAGDVRDAGGSLLHAAGTLLKAPLSLGQGMRLDAGSLLPAAVAVEAMTWPGGVVLPGTVVMAGDQTLRLGAVLPTGANLKLPGGALSVPLRLANGSQQGRNWAVAQMLPEGSQSWAMRLVAGADTTAADSRMLRADGRGSMVLADTHYGLYNIYEKIVIPGTPAQPGGAWYWIDDDFVELLGGAPNSLVDPNNKEFMYYCEYEGLCNRVQYAWNELGVELMPLIGGPEVKLGEPADALIANNPEFAYYCKLEGLCNSLGEPTPAIPPQTIVGDLIKIQPLTKNFSVLRTGTGDLDLLAAGDLDMRSLYGVYTAGTSTASRAGSEAAAFDRARSLSGNTVLGALAAAGEVFEGYEALVDESSDSLYAAWYPDLGGNLTLRVGGGLYGDLAAPYQIPDQSSAASEARPQLHNANVGNWLWRQGSGDTVGVEAMPTSWWINFGTYVVDTGSVNSQLPDASIFREQPVLVGFTGIGTLGGGNLSLDVGKDAGITRTLGSYRSQGLALAVGGTGRVTANGELLLTGGGDLELRVGGSLNPAWRARSSSLAWQSPDPVSYTVQDLSLTGALSNLRGALQLEAGALGGIALNYGSLWNTQDAKESRPYDAFTSTLGNATGGITLVLGDATASLQTRGDLVLAGSGDPGRVGTQAPTGYRTTSTAYDRGGYGWFSLWTENTAISLFSAGGNLAPSTQLAGYLGGALTYNSNFGTSDGRFIYPSQLSGVAANGSVYLGPSAVGASRSSGVGDYLSYPLVLAPSERGSLQLLAADSIYAGGYGVNVSGASLEALPTPFRPAFAVAQQVGLGLNNLSQNASYVLTGATLPLFTFGSASMAGTQGTEKSPTRFYAVDGSIVGLRTGEILSFTSGSRMGQTWYEGSGPVWMMAGRDIVSSGTPLGTSIILNNAMKGGTGGTGHSTGNLFAHSDADAISIVSAGRDILHSTFNVIGPGTLEIVAGRNILMEDRASVTSLGPVLPGDSRPGADIVMQAGFGASGADYLNYAMRYLDPANRANPELALAEQEGKVAHTYESELIDWLSDRYGFVASGEDAAAQALAYFASLSAERQRIFVRQIYFAELRAGGREYNDPDGPRFGSYLRGRNAIAALFPAQSAAGEAIVYQGDLLMYGGAGVHTNAGGDIQVLTPGGRQIFGVEGVAPPSTAGVITQGGGDIQMYSLGSILLGQSRIMTAAGGNILGWSAEGDINAGRGAKTTLVYAPPRRVYDAFGNVHITPDVPATGAGIATLNRGDVDLVAPLGTIDAGEAGIRVAGNVNVAALHVVNADNIQVQGDAKGIPVVAAVNTGALTSASAAASSAATAAQESVARSRAEARQSLPSIISVQILGFGNDAPQAAGSGSRPADEAASYRPDNLVQVVGRGGLSPAQAARLTPDERRHLDL